MKVSRGELDGQHLWETALAIRHTRGLQVLSRLMCHHGSGVKLRLLCECELGISLLKHVVTVELS